MSKSFGGEFPAAKANNDPIWSWFDQPAHGRSESVHGQSGPRAQEAAVRAAQQTTGDFDYPLGNAAIDQKNANMMREVHQAQLRLREQRRGLGDEAQPKSLPAVSFQESGAVNQIDARPVSDNSANMAAQQALGRLDLVSAAGDAPAAREKEAVLRLPQAEATAAREASTGYRQLNDILGNGASVDWLKQAGLLDHFRSQDCHEHLSWSPDGTVNMALRTKEGHRWTILCRLDGTASQRITDQSGRELVRFSSNGKIIENQQRDRLFA